MHISTVSLVSIHNRRHIPMLGHWRRIHSSWLCEPALDAVTLCAVSRFRQWCPLLTTERAPITIADGAYAAPATICCHMIVEVDNGMLLLSASWHDKNYAA